MLLADSPCAADGCGRDAAARGLCRTHYNRFRCDGVPMPRRLKCPRITLTCKGCEKDFTIAPSLAIRADGSIGRKFCTKACMVASLDPRPSFECAQCGLVRPRRKVPATQGYDYRQKFCSRACGYAANTPTYTSDKHGYTLVRIDGVRVSEHREVMATKIGRKLFAYETVHHKDGDKSNNTPSNLELWSSRHGRGQRVEDKMEFCKSFLADYGIHIPTMDPSLLMSGALGCV